ncbi:class I SAM-dependent methyltransferase [Rickettsia endosymbiont of Halotydeus destructor]|uniref:class I SAM-dependent methyltransferase n=1 Tax=Rickettsia endosymbiont of Halotydeus destructor TaxID=2996754 RepID=UPI003BB03BAE
MLTQIIERMRSIIRHPGQLLKKKKKRNCPCCGYSGTFISMRKNLPEMRCPNCASRPRDRLFAHYTIQHNINLEEKYILHFSPEPNLFRRLKRNPNYISSDIKKSKYAKFYVDITDISYPDDYFDIVICNHIMEHVEDHIKGFKECYRVLKNGGIAFFSVPYNSSLEKTWYPPHDMPKEEVEKICGWDHKRIYGQDFPNIISDVGFTVETYLLNNENTEKYVTTLSDPIFIAKKIVTAK